MARPITLEELYARPGFLLRRAHQIAVGIFVEEYRKILQAEALSTSTEPATDTGPLAPLDKPAETSGSGAPATPTPAAEQTAGQPRPAAGQ